MSEEENNNSEQESTKKALKTGAKVAANTYAGPIGGKAVDLASKTKAGNEILNRGSNFVNRNMPGVANAAKAADDSGLTDTVDKLSDSGLSSNDAAGGLSKNQDIDQDKSLNSNGNTETNNSMFGDSISLFPNKKKKLIMSIAGIVLSFFFLIIIVATIITVLYGPIYTASNYVKGIWDNVVDFFTKDQEELEEDFYKKLADVQNRISSNENLCIDVNLITASLTVDSSFDEVLDDGDSDIGESDEAGVNYKKMKKQIDLLANMQITHQKFSLDKDYKNSSGSYCRQVEEIVPVDSNNQSSFERGLFDWITEGTNLDSSTKELIAANDEEDGIFDFIYKSPKKEKNYAYYLYYPAFAADGTCSDTYAKDALNNKRIDEKAEVSIGDYETRTNSVFYWNLVNSFIPSYYKDNISKDEANRNKDILDIADNIYLLYQDIGPNQVCNINATYICRSDEGSDFYTSSDKKLSRQEFINNITPIAIEEMNRVGIYASVTIAQAVLESSGGNSGLSKKYANYYGMTAGSCAPKTSPHDEIGKIYQSGEGGNSCTGNDFWNGSVVALCNSRGEDCQWYRIYDSFANSTRDHSRILTNPTGYYSECNTYSSSLEQITCIKNHGYATDPDYISKVNNVINTYNLTQYDIGSWDGILHESTGIAYVNNMCNSNGQASSGEWSSWKQFEGEWSNLVIGNKTIRQIGCLMTSVAIQIARSGVWTTLGDNFNPGTFMQAHKANGGFVACGGGGARNCFAFNVTAIAPNFKYVGTNSYKSPQQIDEYLKQGYYVILNIHHPGEHHIAIDRVEGDRIYMFDPGTRGTELFTTYSSNLTINSITLYKVG